MLDTQERLIHRYGLNRKVLQWIGDFQTGWQMRVSLRGSKSEWSDVRIGVPQGSVLGPLMCLVYVNDIPEHVDSKVRMFANYTKIWRALITNFDHTFLTKGPK